MNRKKRIRHGPCARVLKLNLFTVKEKECVIDRKEKRYITVYFNFNLTDLHSQCPLVTESHCLIFV